MCGILGYTHVSRGLPAEVLSTGLDSLRHRGPDQQGRFTSPHASLGVTRLRIVDLANGDQPVYSADRDAVIVFNGEIYNHCELRAELEMLGHRFRTRCDTEVVLEAFLAWGPPCFGRMRGMFGAAIWIESQKRLILARDRMGIKPLYYRQQHGEIYFGSEMKCIFAHPGVPRKIDLRGLNCYLSLNYVPGPLTLIDGISKLMPGHYLDWKKGTASIRSFVARRKAAPPPASLDAACEELDGLLTRSVQDQFVSDVPLGIWLSGGLDSSTITHYAAKTRPGRLKTFSITFRGKSFDESSYIRAVSRHYGTDHTEFDLSDHADLADMIDGLTYYSDEPSADAGAVPVWYLSGLSKRNVTVVLSGEGSDELFGGYLTYKADRYRRGFAMLPDSLRKTALALANRIPPSDEKIGFEYKLKRFIQGSLLSPEAAHVFWNGTFTEEEKLSFFRYADAGPLRSILDTMGSGNSVGRYLDFDQRYSLPDALLYKVDRMSMAHALEVRPPFLDERVVDFAARLPESYKISGTQTKVILRRLMKDALPPAILHRPKIGFDIPIHEWFRGVLRPLLLDTLNESAVTRTGLFHWPAIDSLIHQHLQRKANWGYHLWGLLNLLQWMKRWNVQTPDGAPQPLASAGEVFVEEPSSLWQPASCSAQTSSVPLT